MNTFVSAWYLDLVTSFSFCVLTKLIKMTSVDVYQLLNRPKSDMWLIFGRRPTAHLVGKDKRRVQRNGQWCKILPSNHIAIICYYSRRSCMVVFLLTLSSAKYTVEMMIEFNKLCIKLNMKTFLIISCRLINCWRTLRVTSNGVPYVRVPHVRSSGKVSLLQAW